MIPGSTNQLLTAQRGYRISNSLRFRSSASAYLSRTPGTAGNRKTWTWSGWVKRGNLGAEQGLFYRVSPTGTDTDSFAVTLLAGGTISLSGYATNWRITTQVFRDPSSWYHIVVAVDTTQATANNRVRLYVNGSEVTAFSTTNNPALNADTGVNSTAQHSIGSEQPYTSGREFDGYIADTYLIDGQQLDPTYFGQTDAATGVWQPKAYTGTYGTNGFYLNFSDNSGATATTIGKDSSGNGNNWTPNNISVTSGVTYDSMVDTPTNFDNGGNGAGNYCVLNPLNKDNGYTISNGNLDYSCTVAGFGVCKGTIAVSSGKWYWEDVQTTAYTGSGTGVFDIAVALGTYTNSVIYLQSGQKYSGGSVTSYGFSWTVNDVIGAALNMDASPPTVTFYKNNVSQGSINLTSGVSYVYGAYDDTAGTALTGYVNFGQRPFVYAPPSGFKALNTQNLTTPTIINGAQYMDAVLYSGNAPSSRTITGELFSPDFVWIKGRSGATDHALYDTVRGVQLQLESNNTGAETTESTGLTAFTADGFTVGSLAQVNTNTATYVAWLWDAASSNTTIPVNAYGSTPSIASTVRANTTAGFSIVTYQMPTTGTSFTIGHGLGVVPRMIIQKARSTTSNWQVFHTSLGATNGIWLNLTNASGAQTWWNNTAPTSTLFSVNNSLQGASAVDIVAYCFADVAGYSAFGSYVSNGSADGPFIFTGFRPRYIMVKVSTGAGGQWVIWDTARDTYNIVNNELFAQSSAAESGSSADVDILSNGFKIRRSASNFNTGTETVIYAAFAENPFKISRAR